jgi:CBS domain-containing protein
MKVRDIMHEGVACVAPDARISIVAKTMRDLDVGVLPVVENGRVVGIITDRDIVVRALAQGEDPSKLPVRELMTRKVVSCRANDKVGSALRTMEAAKVRRMPVLDGGEAPVGMIGLGDVACARRPDMIEPLVEAVASHHA